MSRHRIGILAAPILLLLCSCVALAETVEDLVEQTLAFAPGDRLEVSNTNGDIEVTGWDRSEIQIEARKRVKARGGDRAREAFEALEIDIRQTASGVVIDTKYPRSIGSWWGGSSTSVQYEIRVPYEADLGLETVNGKIRVDGVRGNLDLGSTNGGIGVEDCGGRVSARTTNGGIDVELQQVATDESMTFRTTNGSIAIALPSDIGADLSARTTNGSVHTEFPITVQGTFKKNRLEGELNGGGAEIDLKTTNGSIRIRQL